MKQLFEKVSVKDELPENTNEVTFYTDNIIHVGQHKAYIGYYSNKNKMWVCPKYHEELDGKVIAWLKPIEQKEFDYEGILDAAVSDLNFRHASWTDLSKNQIIQAMQEAVSQAQTEVVLPEDATAEIAGYWHNERGTALNENQTWAEGFNYCKKLVKQLNPNVKWKEQN